jgi:positive regulator of sigma E activity
MIEKGIVTSIDGDYAIVKVNKKDECAKCGLCLFPKNADSINFRAENGVGAKVNDIVEIETKERAKTLGIVLVFGVPLILVIASLILGYIFIKNEITCLLVTLGVVIVWFFILSIIDRKIKNSLKFSSKIKEIINKMEKGEL